MITLDANILVETGYQGSNNSIVCTRDGLVLIDSPMRPSDAMHWRRVVNGCGSARYLINTEHHVDHTFGNFFLPGEIVSHTYTRWHMSQSTAINQDFRATLEILDPSGMQYYFPGYVPRIPALTFTHRMFLDVGGTNFELVHLSGHAPSSIIVVIPHQGIAFVGDLMCEAGLPSFLDADTYGWIEAVRVIEALDVRHIVPGHGNVCGTAQVSHFRQQMEDIVGQVEHRVDAGPKQGARHHRSQIRR
ncbi:cyclase [Bradyrhizobium sp. LB7.1]